MGRSLSGIALALVVGMLMSTAAVADVAPIKEVHKGDSNFQASVWVPSTIATTSDYQYAALAADGIAGQKIYAAPTNGALDLIMYSGGAWSITHLFQGSGERYVALAADRVEQTRILAARASGGLNTIIYSGGTWNASYTGISISYNALAAETAYLYYYGAPAGGGVDSIYYSSGQWWRSSVADSTYTSGQSHLIV